MKAIALLFGCVLTISAQPPADVVDFFRTATEALANKDAAAFLDHFDPRMPDYAKLRDEVELLLGRSEVGSSIEIVTDTGDDHKRSLQLDWVMQIDQDLPRRQIVTCKLEREKKKWKITSLMPVDFFK